MRCLLGEGWVSFKVVIQIKLVKDLNDYTRLVESLIPRAVHGVFYSQGYSTSGVPICNFVIEVR